MAVQDAAQIVIERVVGHLKPRESLRCASISVNGAIAPPCGWLFRPPVRPALSSVRAPRHGWAFGRPPVGFHSLRPDRYCALVIPPACWACASG